MSTGLSGTYAVNGTDLSLQPTEGKWNQRDAYGYDGAGHPIYSSFRTFELKWQLISTSDLSQMITFFNTVSSTGTLAVDLPQYGANAYQFSRYSGCTLNEVQVGAYFSEYVQDVTLLVLQVRTD